MDHLVPQPPMEGTPRQSLPQSDGLTWSIGQPAEENNAAGASEWEPETCEKRPLLIAIPLPIFTFDAGWHSITSGKSFEAIRRTEFPIKRGQPCIDSEDAWEPGEARQRIPGHFLHVSCQDPIGDHMAMFQLSSVWERSRMTKRIQPVSTLPS